MSSVNPNVAGTRLFSPVLIAGCLILLTGFAIRASFGVFQIPIAEQFGWLRIEFSMAIAIQNLAWGVGQPIFSAIAEKFGDRKAIFLGAITYALGLVLSSFAVTPEAHQFLEILVGFGIAGTGFGVILAVVGRSASADNRSLALGITTAAGSAGQVVGPPVAAALLEVMPWSSVFIVFAVAIIAVLLALPFLRADETGAQAQQKQNLGEVLLKALKDPSYLMIFAGFFSCGFQLAFVTAHFPAYIAEVCSAIPPNSVLRSMGVSTTTALGAFSIALIGLANIIGAVVAGALGKNFSKKYLLSAIYTGRTIAAALFILFPMTPTTVVLFSIVMGALWLATVPLTSGLVAQIYGLQYMGTLYGIIFFSHQLGSFIGVWLGGVMYDGYGSYDMVWWVGVGVGAFSAIIHLPVRENARFQPAAA
ncbi:MFS transporter [Aestuariispira insulae]|uniref:Putative MFS family arabinose efflux permease n=1 Tax=Aestuariispira insulae TaxID=1461337 RepID=A0A3D9HX33_9PROT|nr:MFS transporter [Aestuariispira insulae]RED53970.1 putative MFS family arabinose efflux permease [Aestuariispira insulae]